MSYGINSYPRTGITLRTLERYLGQDTMARVMRDITRSGASAILPRRTSSIRSTLFPGRDMNWFFDQFVKGTRRSTTKSHMMTTEPVAAKAGIYEADVTEERSQGRGERHERCAVRNRDLCEETRRGVLPYRNVFQVRRSKSHRGHAERDSRRRDRIQLKDSEGRERQREETRNTTSQTRQLPIDHASLLRGGLCGQIVQTGGPRPGPTPDLARRFASGDSVTRQRIRWGARVVSGRPVPVDHGADTTTLVPISTIVLTSASVSTAVRIEHAG